MLGKEERMKVILPPLVFMYLIKTVSIGEKIEISKKMCKCENSLFLVAKIT